MASEQRNAYFNKLYMILSLEYGIGLNKNKPVAELIDEAILIDKSPEKLAKEIGQENGLKLRQDKLN